MGPFRNPNFRRLFAGRLVTNVGDSFYFVGAMWLVYELTKDPFFTGLAGFLTLGPAALQFLAGPLVDRWPIRWTLVGTQLIQGVIILVIPIAQYAGVLTVELVLIVIPILAAINQLVYPAQSTALPRLLDDEDLVAANSAFSIVYQGVEIVANSLAGVLIALVGAVTLFLIDAVTFAIAMLLFITVYVPPARTSPDQKSVDTEESDGTVAQNGGESERTEVESYVQDLIEGMRFLRGTYLVWLILGVAVVQFATGIVFATMPVYAASFGALGGIDLLGGAGAYGILMAAIAAGNLIGAIGANVVAERPLGITMIGGYALAGMLWIAAIAVNWLPVTALLIVLALVPVGLLNVQMSAVTQSAPPDVYVGRVSSLLGTASTATLPIGSLAGGVIAATFDVRIAMVLLGFAVLGLAGYVFIHPRLRTLPSTENVSLS